MSKTIEIDYKGVQTDMPNVYAGMMESERIHGSVILSDQILVVLIEAGLARWVEDG